MKQSCPIDEQETTINIFPKSVSDKAEIFTCIPSMMNRLRKLAVNHPDEVALREEDMCIFCTLPVGWIRIAPKRQCTLTEEQKRANAERLAAYREANKT